MGRPPFLPGKVENCCTDPWGGFGEEGSALGNYASTCSRKRPCRPGRTCALHYGRQRECLYVHMEACYTPHEERAVVIHSHHPPVRLQQTNKQQHGTQRAALPRQTTNISKGSVFFMNNEISAKNTYTTAQTHMLYAT